MRILNLTKHKRILLKEMLNNLFSEFDRIKLQRNGMVLFWKNKWKFWHRTKIHVSELVIKEIPLRIEKLAMGYTSRNYPYWTPKIREEIIKIINDEEHRDIIEFLWKEFTKVKFPINKMKPSLAIMRQYWPVTPGPITYRSIFNNYCKSLIRSPAINYGDTISHIKALYKKREKKVIKFNIKRILDPGYIPVRQLMAA